MKTYLYWYLAVIVAVILTAGFLNAGEAQKKSTTKNYLSKSLQFQIYKQKRSRGERSAVKGFLGLAFSGKFHLSKSRAIRLGFSLDGRDLSQEIDRIHIREYENIYRSQILSEHTDRNGKSISINAHYLVYPSAGKKMKLFFGAGPSFQYAKSERETFFIRETEYSNVDTTYTLADSLDLISYYRSWAGGLDCLIGVEWFVAKPLSFHAEYGVYLHYVHYKNDSRTESYDNNYDQWRNYKRKYFTLDSHPVRFGFSVYF